MSKEHSRPSIISVAVLLALIVANVLLSFPLSPAKSDPKPKSASERRAEKAVNDFHAETIEPPSAPLAPVKPLPVELVEEPNEPLAVTAPTVAPTTPPQTSPGAVPPTGGESATGGLPAGDEEESDETDATVTTSLNGNEIDIAALVKTFSKLTKRNYIVDNNVKGKVAIHLATPVTIPEALRIFESVLLLKGFTTVPMGNNTYKVIAAKDAKQTTIPMMSNDPDRPSDALVTKLIRLKNTEASELQQVLQQFVSKDGMINAFGATNALILIDSAANIQRLARLVEQLDVPALDQDITIIPVLHAEAKDVADKINEILGEKEGKQDATQANALRPGVNPASLPVPRPGVPPGQGTNSGIATSGERRQLPLKLIPDERTNSLIVVADQLLTEKVRALAEQLDSPVDRSGGKFYVYRLQHADAEEVSQILNSVITGEAPAPSSSSSGTQSSRTGSSSLSGGSRSGQDRALDQLNQANRTANRPQTQTGLTAARFGGEEGGKVNLEGEVTVAADTSTNSLVINASRADYQKIKELIDLLDVKRRQVLVEATILEVSLTKNEGMGVEWQTSGGTDEVGGIAQTNYGGITNILSNPAALSDLTIAAASSGSIVLPGGITLPSQALLITALSRNQNVNVLSTPTILAIDNQEAEIKVGENVPFVTSTSTNQTNLNNTFNQIERQDVGIKLRITPQISAGDFVVLKIFVEISNVVPGTRNDPNGPTTTIRTTETVVEVKSEQMVVTGGLIADSVTDSSRGVPFFEDIPVLGNMFRRDDSERRRNNLLVFITPRIITDQFVARDKTLVKRDSMEKTIAEQQAEPDRNEVLRSEDLDRVTESHPLGDTEPTTVTPPTPARAAMGDDSAVEMLATKRTAERIRELTGAEPTISGDSPAPRSKATHESEEEIEINVQPALPGDKASSAKGSDSRSSLALPPAEGSAGKTFVVLREVGRSPAKNAKLPFRYADNEKTLGITLDAPLGTAGSTFFEVGERYTFQQSGVKAKYVCLGRYGSLGEAKIMHPALATEKKWYTVGDVQSHSGWSAG